MNNYCFWLFVIFGVEIDGCDGGGDTGGITIWE
jgi:hypothetical protein